MSLPPSNPTPEEVARLGNEIYDRHIRSEVEPAYNGKVIAIDIHSGAYALDENALSAAKQLRSHHPDAEVWFVRVGHRTLHRIGSGLAAERT